MSARCPISILIPAKNERANLRALRDSNAAEVEERTAVRPVLREALTKMGRSDLIGGGKHQLVPSWQPAGTSAADRRGGPRARLQPGVALTQHTGLPPRQTRDSRRTPIRKPKSR